MVLGEPLSSADSSDPLVERTLGGFVLHKKVGSGGFGDVYLAEQVALKREAVVKVLRDAEHDDQRIQRFLREAQLASQLDHPYAAHIYAFGAEPDGLLWIAMEWVRGSSLRALLEAQGPMPLERFVPLLERICEVVHTAHDQGIIHRDLKPDNVMVISRAGRMLPKLLDFGIARAMQDRGPTLEHAAGRVELEQPAGVTTQRGAVLGSPPYMAPELWVDPHGAGPPADQYALGALAFEALSGRMGFTGKTVLEIARAHAKTKLPSLGPEFGELDLVLRKATSRAPGDRYGNVLELAQAVRAASGIGSPTAEIPKLDEELRVKFLVGAPQPLADAVGAYDAARNAHQAREALRNLVRISASYVGILALACRTRVGSGGGDSDHAQQLLRDLRRQGLTSPGWVALARQLTQPFARSPDTHPLPELVLLLHSAERRTDAFAPALEGTLSESLAESSEDAAIQAIARELPIVTVLLRSLAFLLDYQLAVPRDEAGVELWMGTRGAPKRTIEVRRKVPPNRPILVDELGNPLVALWPLVQVHAAVPGHSDEIFFLAGPGRQGARLVSSPHSFEHHDASLWEWFRDQLFDDEATSKAVVDESPYRGLAAYTTGDAKSFFGRERETDVLVNRLKLETFVAVVGPSGVGKSSFVHAGVVPSLEGWRVITMRPGRAAIAHLVGALRQAGLDLADTEIEVDALAARCTAWATEVGGALIIIDQFEELFTMGSTGAQREQFVRAIFAIASAPRHPIRIVITLRDDFLIRAEQLPGFADALARGLHLLGPLGPAALERILVEPARRVGYEFEDPTLPARMAEETAGAPSAVALISFTAARLWELRDRHFHQLPRKAYDALGGVVGALAQHADETVEAMPPAERALVRKAFRHLVTFEGTRAILTRSELELLVGGGEEASRLVERLIAARLVVTSENERGELIVEIIHEALVSAWPRLAEWRREDVEGSRFHEQLRGAARQWEDRGRPRGLLWRSDALAEYQRWRQRHVGALTPLETAFGAASVADAMRGRNIRRALIGVAIVMTAVFVVFLLRANREANAQTTRAEDLLRGSYFEQGRLLALQGDKLKALHELVAAYRMGDVGPTIRLMIEEILRCARGRKLALEGHTDKLWDVKYSPDGKLIATASADRTAIIWDAETGQIVATIKHDQEVRSVAFSPDGRWLATASEDQTARLWNVETNRAGPVLAIKQKGSHVVFSPDSKQLLVTGQAGGAALWSLAGEAIATLGPHRDVVVGAFCASGNCIVTADSVGSLVLWDAHTHAQRMRFEAKLPIFTAPSVDRDGTTIAFGTGSGELTLLKADGSVIAKTQAHRQLIWGTTMSPDGTTVVSFSADGVAKLWETATGKLRAELMGHHAFVTSATFSSSGDMIATTSADGTSRLWSALGAGIGELDGHSANVYAAAFRNDGRQLVTASWDHHAIVWDVATALQFRSLDAALIDVASSAPSMVFSPDSKHVALIGVDLSLVITDLVVGTTCRVHRDKGFARVAWDPASAVVATVNFEDPVIRVWRASSCELVHTLEGHTADANAVAFASDGTLASGADDRTVRLWDVAAGRERRKLDDFGAAIDSVGFFDDPPRVYAVTSVANGHSTVALVDLVSWRRQVLQAGPQALTAIEHDARRHRVLASGMDQFVWIWDDRTGAVVKKLEGGGVLWGVRSSRDGAIIVAVGGVSPTVWNAETLEKIGDLEGHVDTVLAGGFIGERIFVTVGRDYIARVWDLNLLRPTLRIEETSGLAISPDLKWLVFSSLAASTLVGGTTRLWHPDFPIPNLQFADQISN